MTDGRPRKILIVDDDRDTADSLFIIMRTHGDFEPHVAYCPEYALHVAASTLPDVVVLDLGKPSMDGYAIGQAVREASPDSTIIVVSGHGGREFLDRSALAGFYHHLVKPVDPQKLLDLISTIPAGTA